MRKLIVFNSVTLDGYYTSEAGDMSWAHKDPQDEEWNSFTGANASGGGVLVFGRITYELMARYWPTPMAMQHNRAVAEGMNSMEKVEFSRTLHSVSWSNTTLIKADPVSEIRRMKDDAGADLVILGSGSLVAPLAEAGLIDEYQIVVNPVALGEGKTLFEGVKKKVALRLLKTRSLANGSVVLWYQPAA
jgi:dihydrofolate reductase